jgi:hypothetical protein
MSDVPFTRPTILAAVAFLNARLTQAGFNHIVLRLGLENEILRRGAQRCQEGRPSRPYRGATTPPIRRDPALSS